MCMTRYRMSHHASRSDTTDALYPGLIAFYVFDTVVALRASRSHCIPVILWILHGVKCSDLTIASRRVCGASVLTAQLTLKTARHDR